MKVSVLFATYIVCLNLSDNYVVCEQMLEQHKMEIIHTHGVFQSSFLLSLNYCTTAAAS